MLAYILIAIFLNPDATISTVRKEMSSEEECKSAAQGIVATMHNTVNVLCVTVKKTPGEEL